jgi:hypothetical protein
MGRGGFSSVAELMAYGGEYETEMLAARTALSKTEGLEFT